MAAGARSDETSARSSALGSNFDNPESRRKPHRELLFGYPIRHSLAPLLHSTLFRSNGLPWTFELHETQDASEILPTLKAPGVVGCAVTMPYKVAMMSFVDEVTEEGQMIGAINTVYLRRATDGRTRYIGTNTDCLGIRESFLRNFPDLPDQAFNKPALVIGAGGACRAAIYALWKWLGTSRVYIVNRLESEVAVIINWFKAVGCPIEILHVSSIEQAALLETPVLVVGTVPDITPKNPGEILCRNIISTFLTGPKKGYILEMCYHPIPRTEFFNLGEKAGWKMLYGTEALIWQGVAQQALWMELPQDSFKLEEVHKVVSNAIEHNK